MYVNRTIIEVVNENTLIIDKPFPKFKTLPQFNFDFKLFKSTQSRVDQLSLYQR